MGILEKLKNNIESNEIRRKKSHLKNLYSIAIADGVIKNQEFDFLLKICKKLYLENHIVQHVVNFSEDISFVIPKNDNEKIDNIYDYICMAIIDGELNEKEIGICKLIAVRFGFRPIIVDLIITEILDSISKGIANKIIVSKLLKMI